MKCQWFPWGSESLVANARRPSAFREGASNLGTTSCWGRLGGPKIEIQCSHRNTGPPAILGYMFAIVCVYLHSFRGSGKEGLLTLNFPQASFIFQYVVSTGFHATFRQKQMVWVFSTKTTQCKAGSIWKVWTWHLPSSKTPHQLVPIWLRAGCLALIKGKDDMNFGKRVYFQFDMDQNAF